MKRDHHLVPMKEEQEEECGGGMDELLAVLGYKVRSSQMADVALKLEQLEEIMGNAPDHGFSHLPNHTLHYNPSDLYSWLDTMRSDFNPPPPSASATDTDDSSFSPRDSSTITSVGFGAPIQQSRILCQQSSLDSDLNSIPGNAIYSQPPSDIQFGIDSSDQMENTSKRLKCSTSDSMIVSTSTATTESTRSVILVDSQENGVRLVHALLACAEAVQNENLTLAEALVKQIGFLAVSQSGAMRKVATYFAEALARRIYRLFPSQSPIDHTLSDTLQMHFYETCPYLKFAHFTANQAILEAFQGKKRVHVIDFSMNQGLQWPALIQALATRPGGPPAFRLTGIGPPSSDNFDYLHEVGCKLAQLAEAVNVDFKYRGFVANSLADLDVSMLEMRGNESETVAVNSVFELHKLLGRAGAIEKVLGVVNEMKPEIFTVVEQESNHNSPVFLDRFTESLHYYSSLFDSLEGVPSGEDKVMSEVYLGKQICNVVACDGTDRIERHETLSQWRNRFGSAGLSPVYMSSDAFKQASMLLGVFNAGEGYQVEEKDGCMMLGWYTRPLIATSAWRLSTKPL